jgi:hypothetical protein
MYTSPTLNSEADVLTFFSGLLCVTEMEIHAVVFYKTINKILQNICKDTQVYK